ncbi:DUF6567 family protein [Winogradskyella forsetii]|uniref:DUF6567 family protein n=1 Tax=Winogradskyella forsetii TaxID=2686077 RepID=UPI0015C07DF5|nr:DUF6567 family protein [Winogradskyella forsetii]
MKANIKTISVLFLLTILSSCGYNHMHVLNQNHNNTQVELSQNNFEVLGQVKGSAEVNYVLIFGGRKKQELYNAAYSEMLEKADIVGNAKVLTNIITEQHIGGYPPFFYTRTLTVKANVVQFTK